MSNNFQQSAEQNSAGSLLLGAIFGGLTSEAGQMLDLAADTAEIASEVHTHYHQKAEQKPIKLGEKNCMTGAFARGVSNMVEGKPTIQKRYLNFDYTPKPGMSMAMAA